MNNYSYMEVEGIFFKTCFTFPKKYDKVLYDKILCTVEKSNSMGIKLFGINNSVNIKDIVKVIASSDPALPLDVLNNDVINILKNS